MIRFIGIGAQKSGTSWAYACLYEHPQICAPIKEIHFFSRSRFSEGKEWYESHFSSCGEDTLAGEFSTSYLYSREAPERIKQYYPETKLIAILRNPIDRAYSQYRNAIKAGEIPESESFDAYAHRESSVLEQGMYAAQLARYEALFPRHQMLVLVYEDIAHNPKAFMERIYTFLEIDPTFTSKMLYTHVNTARTPRLIWIDRLMHHIAEGLRKIGLHRLVWFVRLLRIPDLIRIGNTKKKGRETKKETINRSELAAYFREDAQKLSPWCGRDMVQEWNLL